MKPIVKVLLVVAALVALAVLFVVGSTAYFFATKQTDREIARDVEISTQWIELTPQPPLKATKQIPTLIIAVDGSKRPLDDTRLKILLPDGSTANPEVVLGDANGNMYQLRASQILSTGLGYTAGSSLLRDEPYTKVRIRSDKPFRAANIYWENLNLE